MKKSDLKPLVLITVIGATLFIPFLGRVNLFDWDEINFAESAREMIVSGNYSEVMIDFKPFWEKPPLFFWLQAASMKVFGINEFASRFPNAVCGIITLCLIFFLGRKYFDETFGWLWVLAYAGSFLPHFYFKSGIIDPWFNLFIFTGIVFLIHVSEQENFVIKQFVFSGIFTGLAVLTKGPAALLIVMLTGIIFSVLKGTKWVRVKSGLAFFLGVFLVSSLWFGMEIIQNGTGIFKRFVQYQSQLFGTEVAGYGGPFYYHALVLLVGCFPASIIALNGFFNKHEADSKQLGFRLWMLILFFVVLVLFSIVQTKIIHYSSLCYLPLTFLAAWEIHFAIKRKTKFYRPMSAFLLLLGIVIGASASLLPYLGNHKDLVLPYITDSFARENLKAGVDWPPVLMLFGISYAALLMASVILMKKNFIRGVILLFAATCIFIQVILFSFAPRIERYTQGAAIDFYKSLQGKDVYVEVLGFKSYAHLFYTRKQPQANPMSHDKDWLLNGDIDKPAYFVCKITKAPPYRALSQLEEIGSKNGFVFFRREPKSK